MIMFNKSLLPIMIGASIILGSAAMTTHSFANDSDPIAEAETRAIARGDNAEARRLHNLGSGMGSDSYRLRERAYMNRAPAYGRSMY
jgi:hypothetical protein